MMTFHLHIWFGVNVRQRNQPANCVRDQAMQLCNLVYQSVMTYRVKGLTEV